MSARLDCWTAELGAAPRGGNNDGVRNDGAGLQCLPAVLHRAGHRHEAHRAQALPLVPPFGGAQDADHHLTLRALPAQRQHHASADRELIGA